MTKGKITFTIVGHIFGPGPAIEPGSPLKLTDLGESIAKEFGADDWAREKAKILHPRVADLPEYEIEQFCFKFVYDEFARSDERADDISRISYSRGSPKAQIYDVLAVVLRKELIGRRTSNPQAPHRTATN